MEAPCRRTGFAKTYEIAHRYREDGLKLSRRELLDFLCAHLREYGIAPDRDVRSVFDVGCSLGYMLRFVETNVFLAATCLRGLDVDEYAVETGAAHLRRLASKVELAAGDIRHLDSVLNGRKYDVVLCCGVLMYLDEDAAARAIKAMLAHTQGLLALSTLANPEEDNFHLAHSYARPEDMGFIHNIDQMVRQAGGSIVFRRWTNPEQAKQYASYALPLFTLARPGR